jgi:hypothetical protein
MIMFKAKLKTSKLPQVLALACVTAAGAKLTHGMKFENQTKGKEKFSDIGIIFKNGWSGSKKVVLHEEQLEQIVRLVKQLRFQLGALAW